NDRGGARCHRASASKNGMRQFCVVAVLIAGAMGAQPVLAADLVTAPVRSQWTVTLGAEGAAVPSFYGSDRYVFRPTPLIDIRPAGTPPRFHSPRESLGFGIIDTGRFRFGPVGKLIYPRREGNDGDLVGLGDIGWGLELGAFADF